MNAYRHPARPGGHSCPGGARRGSLLAEVVAALGVFVIVMGLNAQILSGLAHERRSGDLRDWALQEAQNVLERLRVVPVERLNAAALPELKLGERTERALPGGRLDVTLSGPDEVLTRATVVVRWRGRGGTNVAPVVLTTWFASAARGTEATMPEGAAP